MMAAVNFMPYSGYLMGLPVTENHAVFRWIGPGKVLFSVARQGNAASCHFASDKGGLRGLKKACDQFVKFCFDSLPWCEMCVAHIGKPSIGRLIEKIGFVWLCRTDSGNVFVRLK